jgi:hypothetical protein
MRNVSPDHPSRMTDFPPQPPEFTTTEILAQAAVSKGVNLDAVLEVIHSTMMPIHLSSIAQDCFVAERLLELEDDLVTNISHLLTKAEVTGGKK